MIKWLSLVATMILQGTLALTQSFFLLLLLRCCYYYALTVLLQTLQLPSLLLTLLLLYSITPHLSLNQYHIHDHTLKVMCILLL
jgi:hypothetical protein